jgi:hypothetical protein
MKKVLTVLLPAACLLSCGGSKTYPEQVKQNFINGCAPKVKGNTALCSCLFEKIENKYSFSEYVKIEEQMKAGQTPQDFLRFIDSVTTVCFKETKK